MARLPRCEHGNGRTLCFECFKAGSERTKARQDAWAQRMLPFEETDRATGRKLTETEIAHRRRMLAYLEASARRRA
jgi:hypothetical protein